MECHPTSPHDRWVIAELKLLAARWVCKKRYELISRVVRMICMNIALALPALSADLERHRIALGTAQGKVLAYRVEW